jgi:hypothetical protein
MSDRGVLGLSAALRKVGLSIVRFNFVYREQGGRRPDPMPRLMECFAAVVARAWSECRPERLLLGGRSMGGRAASTLAAQGFDCDGLVLVSYPLHPAGQPEKLRSAHLADIRVPVLCLNGTRDSLCRRDLMDRATAGLPGWTMHWLADADHGLHVPRSSGRTDEQVLEELAASAAKWVEGRAG